MGAPRRAAAAAGTAPGRRPRPACRGGPPTKPCAVASPRSIAEPTWPTGVADRPSWSSADQRQVGVVAAARHGGGRARPCGSCGAGAALQAGQQRHDQRDQRDHRGLRVARQPGQEPRPAVRAGHPGQQHREAGPDGDGVDHVLGAELGQRRVQVVDRAVHGAAGGADQVGRRPAPRGSRRRARRGCPAPGRPTASGSTVAPQRRSHAGHLRAERVADPAGAGRARGEQLVAEDQQRRARLPAHGQRVVSAGRGEPDHGRVDRACRPAAAPRRLCASSPGTRHSGVLAGLAADQAVAVAGGLLDPQQRRRRRPGTIAPVAISTQVPSSVERAAPRRRPAPGRPAATAPGRAPPSRRRSRWGTRAGR